MSKLAQFRPYALTPFQLTKLSGGGCDYHCTVTWTDGASSSGAACGDSALGAANRLHQLYTAISDASGSGASFSVSCR